MFGTFRYILALGVVTTHLWPESLRWAGYYSVFSFYMLSGYLMTLVLNERYGFSSDGLKRFFANRALRIYPPYLFVLALALLLAVFLPKLTFDMNRLITVPGSARDWFSNIFIFGAWFERSLTHARLVPPAWSLHVELFYYVAMAIALSRSFKVTLLWFLASLGFTIFAVASGMDFITRYYTVPAGSLAFSTGALIYFARERLTVPAWFSILAGLAFLGNVAFSGQLWGEPVDIMMYGFYASFAISAALIISLRRVHANGLPSWLKKADRFLGNLSYPLFLIHWHIAILLVWLVYGGERPAGGELMLVSLPLASLAAWLLHAVIEKRVERIRDRYKKEETPGKTLKPTRLSPANGAAISTQP